jgi:hypothetical protein
MKFIFHIQINLNAIYIFGKNIKLRPQNSQKKQNKTYPVPLHQSN